MNEKVICEWKICKLNKTEYRNEWMTKCMTGFYEWYNELMN